METMDISLIHRVLLTAPNEYDTLTMSGRPRVETLAFAAFVDQMNSSKTIQGTLERAYRDSLVDRVYQQQTMAAIMPLLLQLYDNIKQLVPNRKDWQALLPDPVHSCCTNPEEMKPDILIAAHALQQLESPDRGETTMEWISGFSDHQNNNLLQQLQYATNSLFYLLYKTELCQQDKADFYLQHVHANLMTIDMERKWFQTTIGTQMPLTRRWIQSLVPTFNYDISTQQPHTFMTWIQTSWIDTILFRGEPTSLDLPEIWTLDVANIHSIRETTKQAAIGSALGLLCCQVAGGDTMTMTSDFDVDPYSHISLRRGDLNQTLNHRNFSTQEEFETKVADDVVNLARALTPTLLLSTEAMELLRHRTKQVLSAQDPVLFVLEKRMKQLFRTMVTWDQGVELKSGIQTSTTSRNHRIDSSFIKVAKSQCRELGLGYSAMELAKAVDLARRVVILSWKVHGVGLEEMILHEYTNQSSGEPVGGAME